MLGNGRLEAMCFDGEKRLAHIRGKLRKKVWINQGDIILLSLRDYQDEKGDVILKYTADEARNLKAYGELPENAKINETDTYGMLFPCVGLWKGGADEGIKVTRVPTNATSSSTSRRARLISMLSKALVSYIFTWGAGLRRKRSCGEERGGDPTKSGLIKDNFIP